MSFKYIRETLDDNHWIKYCFSIHLYLVRRTLLVCLFIVSSSLFLLQGSDLKPSSMAEHLASIFGTEKDRVNCPFYFKIGACRHGDRCSRLHTKPSISPTLLLSNMYQRPDMITPGVDAQGQPIDPRKIQDHFEEFYEDLFEELSKYGEIESLNICDNLADHMVCSLLLYTWFII